LACSERREGWKRRPGAAGIATVYGRGAEEGKGREEGEEGGTDRWGPGVSDRGKKKRREEDAGRYGERENGPVGRKVRWGFFSFFPFFFLNSFQIKTLKFKFKQNLSNFHIIL
jgi:hypothetical protein